MVTSLFDLLGGHEPAEDGESKPAEDDGARTMTAVADMRRIYETLSESYKNQIERMQKKARSSDVSRMGWHGDYAYSNYPKNQWMGDAAYVLYQETNEPVYLRLAEFYYRSARLLAKAQHEGQQGFRLPEGGEKKVEERMTYCDDALSVIEDLSREGENELMKRSSSCRSGLICYDQHQR